MTLDSWQVVLALAPSFQLWLLLVAPHMVYSYIRLLLLSLRGCAMSLARHDLSSGAPSIVSGRRGRSISRLCHLSGDQCHSERAGHVDSVRVVYEEDIRRGRCRLQAGRGAGPGVQLCVSGTEQDVYMYVDRMGCCMQCCAYRNRTCQSHTHKCFWLGSAMFSTTRQCVPRSFCTRQTFQRSAVIAELQFHEVASEVSVLLRDNERSSVQRMTQRISATI